MPGDDAKVPNILYILPNLKRGGTERRVVRLASGGAVLGDEGWRSEIVLLYSQTEDDDDSELIRICNEANVNIERLGLKSWRKPWNWMSNGNKLRKFRKSVKNKDFNILHPFLPSCNIFALNNFGENTDHKVIISQSALANYRKGRFFLALMEDTHYRKADAMFSNSRAVEHNAQRNINGIDSLPSFVAYNGVEGEEDSLLSTGPERDKAREALGIPVGHFTFLVLANLIPYKGHGTAIEALAKASDLNIFLVFAGADSSGIKSELEHLATKLNVRDKILFHPPTPEPAKLYSLSDGLLSASTEEGFSNSILEAMAAALPIVATNVGGTPEALGEDYRWLVPVGDADAMAQALQEAALNPEQSQEIGRSLQARQRELFTINRMCRDVGTMYRKVLDTAD